MAEEIMPAKQPDTQIPAEESTALTLAYQLEEIYQKFTDSIKKMGAKHGKKGKSKLAASALHWIAGSHVKTERDVLCEKFLQDVEKHLELFDYALQDADKETAQEACAVLADTLTTTVGSGSNSTTDLMKRAMIGHIRPYLPMLSADKLQELKQKIESAYPKSQRLPVEKEVLKEMTRLLS